MKKYFKSKRKLRKNVKIYLYILILIPMLIYMHNNNFLKQLFYKSAHKYVENNIFQSNTSFKSGITSAVFNVDSDKKSLEIKNNVEHKVNDEMFTVKEEKNNNPIVYLYNTHEGEKYRKMEGTDFTPSIKIATRYLKEKFENSGINTIVETRSIIDVLNENNWSYGSSYRVSRSFLENTVLENPSIKYIFDIHRDSGTHEYTTLCVNQKCYAKILFLIGLENPYYMENQKYAETLSKNLNEKVEGISKGILQKKGPKVNGVYNEDFSNRTMLIELGGENNTIDEVYNTIDVLSEVLTNYIKEEISNG